MTSKRREPSEGQGKGYVDRSQYGWATGAPAKGRPAVRRRAVACRRCGFEPLPRGRKKCPACMARVEVADAAGAV